jgi:hypothetical protein
MIERSPPNPITSAIRELLKNGRSRSVPGRDRGLTGSPLAIYPMLPERTVERTELPGFFAENTKAPVWVGDAICRTVMKKNNVLMP